MSIFVWIRYHFHAGYVRDLPTALYDANTKKQQTLGESSCPLHRRLCTEKEQYEMTGLAGHRRNLRARKLSRNDRICPDSQEYHRKPGGRNQDPGGSPDQSPRTSTTVTIDLGHGCSDSTTAAYDLGHKTAKVQEEHVGADSVKI